MEPTNPTDLPQAFDTAAKKPTIDMAGDFGSVAGSPQVEKKPETPEFEYRPPEPAPGGTISHVPESKDVNTIAREELDRSARDSIAEAKSRFDDGKTELDTYLPSIDEVEGAPKEYERWSRDHDDGAHYEQEPENDHRASRFSERDDHDIER